MPRVKERGAGGLEASLGDRCHDGWDSKEKRWICL